MSKQLPMAINPSVNYNNNFQLIELPDNHLNHFFFADFVIEVNTKTIEAGIALFLGISHEWCTTYIGGDQNFTHCQYPQNGFKGHYMRYRGITLDQLQILWAKAKNARADKYKPILSELILTQVLPLFNQPQQLIKHDDFKKEIDMNLVTSTQPITMSSQEMSNLTEIRHDSVKRTMETLHNKGVISFTQTVENPDNKGGRPKTIYHVNKRDSYVVVAQLSPEFTAKLVDRWQELENQVATPALPTSYKDALLMLAQKVGETEELAAENERLNKTKMQIGSKREASAMGKLARANDKIKQLTAMANVKDMSETIQNKAVKFATILAIQSRVDNLKANGLKLANFCRRKGLEIKSVDDVRFGRVNSYPAEAWREVYNININSILGA